VSPELHEYDAWKRLVRVRADDGGSPGATLAEYRYDAAGRRIARLVPAGPGVWTRTDLYYNEKWQANRVV